MQSRLRSYCKRSRSHRPVAGQDVRSIAYRTAHSAVATKHPGRRLSQTLIEVYLGGGPAGEGEGFSPFFFPPSGFP